MKAGRFQELVGQIIHACGLLEWATDLSIKQLGKDPLLVREIVQLTFTRRIKILRELLHERTELSDEDVNSLCAELEEIDNLRNKVAHNPIASVNRPPKDVESFILARRKFDPPEEYTISEAELEPLPKRAFVAMGKLLRSMPNRISF